MSTRRGHVARTAVRWVALALVSTWGCVGDPADPPLSSGERAALSKYVVDRAPADTIGHEASFGGSPADPDVSLVGYLLQPRTLTQAPGSTFALTLVWRVHRPPPDGFRVFTHLVDGRGRLLANLDSQGPLRAKSGGAGAPMPPSRWPAGRVVLDRVDVKIPADAPYDLQLLIGLYRGGQRLAVHGDGAEPRLGVATVRLSAAKDQSAAATVPELEVPRLSSEARIVIDGMLDEDAWRAAAKTGAFVSPTTGRTTSDAPVQGNARILYDDQHLYIAFEIADRNVIGGFDETKSDPHLWERDTAEIMLDPDGDGDNADYYEIQIGPQNLVFDSRFDDYNLPRGGPKGPFGHEGWSAKLTSAVTVNGTIDDDSDQDGGYLVEARIPFRSFDKAKRTPPKPGDTWRANFYAMQNNGGVAWSPILGKGNFHRASRFGRLLWSERTVP